MSVSVSVNVEDGLSPVIRQVLGAIGPENRRGLVNVAARHALNALRTYHRQYNAAGRWSRRGGSGSEFGEEVARGWGLSKSDETGATLTNAAPHFAFKIQGGTIRPKRVRALTVPLIPEARGRFAETYERVFGVKLFIPKGTGVLAEKLPGGGFRAVYALKQSVTHKAWPGAMPDDNVYVEPFVRSISEQLAKALE